MKNPKKPTRLHKELMAGQGLDPKEWGTIKEDGDCLHIINRLTGETKTIEKKKRRG